MYLCFYNNFLDNNMQYADNNTEDVKNYVVILNHSLI